VLTAALTFGTLFALKRSMCERHLKQRSEHCAKDIEKNNADESQPIQSDETVLTPSEE
jgi:hypothetical protein